MESKVEAGTGLDHPLVPRDPPSPWPEADALRSQETREKQAFWIALGGTVGKVRDYEGAL